MLLQARVARHEPHRVEADRRSWRRRTATIVNTSVSCGPATTGLTRIVTVSDADAATRDVTCCRSSEARITCTESTRSGGTLKRRNARAPPTPPTARTPLPGTGSAPATMIGYIA